MPRDKTESHRRVLQAAWEEFAEYGFEKASMRRIGQRCGMTVAGLYRHCRDKEDLFDQLVRPYVEKIDDWMEKHISRSLQSLQDHNVDLRQDSEIDLMRGLIYPDIDAYRLILTGSRGTRYENWLHDLTRKQQDRMMEFLPVIRERGYAVKDISSEQLHILLSAYVQAMFEPVIHGFSREQALDCLELLETFFLPGWKQLLGF